MNAARRLDRLERCALDSSPVHEDMDAEIERLAGELEEREGPGAFARLLAEVEAELYGTDRERAGAFARLLSDFEEKKMYGPDREGS